MSEQQILQTIGQLDASISKVEPYLDQEDFRDYCDSTYQAISHWRFILKQVKENKKDDSE